MQNYETIDLAMSEGVQTRSVTVNNPQGLHARPADKFARLANQFEADIHVVKNGERIDAKSVLCVLTLAAEQGTQLIMEALGKDARSALDALAKLVESDFNLEETTGQGQSS